MRRPLDQPSLGRWDDETSGVHRGGRRGRHTSLSLPASAFARSFSLGSFACRRLIIPRHSAESDVDSISAIDGNDRERELDQFLFCELFPRQRKYMVRYVAIGKPRQSFRPGQRGALAPGIKRTFLPGTEKVKALFRFSRGAQLF